MFVKEFLTVKLGFQIAPNAKTGKISTNWISSSFTATLAKHAKIRAAYTKLSSDKKKDLGKQLIKALIIHIVKTVLKYLFMKLLEATLSIAIPGAGIVLLIYKIYKAVEAKISVAGKKKDKVKMELAVELGALVGVGTVKACIEIQFTQANLAKLIEKWTAIKEYFKSKLENLKNYLQNKLNKFTAIFSKCPKVANYTSLANEAIDKEDVNDLVDVNIAGSSEVSVEPAAGWGNLVSDILEWSDIFG